MLICFFSPIKQQLSNIKEINEMQPQLGEFLSSITTDTAVLSNQLQIAVGAGGELCIFQDEII